MNLKANQKKQRSVHVINAMKVNHNREKNIVKLLFNGLYFISHLALGLNTAIKHELLIKQDTQPRETTQPTGKSTVSHDRLSTSSVPCTLLKFGNFLFKADFTISLWNSAPDLLTILQEFKLLA